MVLLSRAEEIILLAIFKLKNDAYGVTIREQVYKDIGNYWSFGVIYKTLNKMRNKGFVKKIQSEPLAERGGRSKYYYRITSGGLQALEDIHKVHSSIWTGVRNLAAGNNSK